MVIDDKAKETIVEVFKACYAISENVKTLNGQAREMRTDLSKFLKVPVPAVNTAYSEWKKRNEKPAVMDSASEIIDSLF